MFDQIIKTVISKHFLTALKKAKKEDKDLSMVISEIKNNMDKLGFWDKHMVNQFIIVLEHANKKGKTLNEVIDIMETELNKFD